MCIEIQMNNLNCDKIITKMTLMIHSLKKIKGTSFPQSKYSEKYFFLVTHYILLPSVQS